MGITGPGIPDGAYVAEINGAYVTMGGGTPTQSHASATLTFSAGGAAFIQQDFFATVAQNGTGYPGRNFATIHGRPYYSNAFIVMDQARAIFETFGWLNQEQVVAKVSAPSGVSQIEVDNATGIKPGMLLMGPNVKWGVRVVSVNGKQIVLSKPTASAFDKTPLTFGFQAQINGRRYILTNASVLHTGTDSGDGSGPDLTYLPGREGEIRDGKML